MSDEGTASTLSRSLPSAEAFILEHSSGWYSSDHCPDWLFKRAEQVYFHVPTASLWRRHGKALARLDVCRSAISSFAAAAPLVLLRAAFASWRSLVPESATSLDVSPRKEAARPMLRKAPKGLRHGGHSRGGVSPPPAAGWSCAFRGWERHDDAPKWLRKPLEDSREVFDADDADDAVAEHIYFYVPSESFWMELPNGTFACIETYHAAVAALLTASNTSLLRTTFCSWRSQAQVVREWRGRIGVMSASFGEDEEEGQAAETVAEARLPQTWSVKTAFLDRRGEVKRPQGRCKAGIA